MDTAETLGLDAVRARICSVLGYCQLLTDVSQANGLKELQPDIRRMWDSARQFLELSEKLQAEQDGFGATWLRHDLLGCLNQIVLYSEIVMEDARAMNAVQLCSDLQKVRAAAHSLAEPVGRLFDTALPTAPPSPNRLGEALPTSFNGAEVPKGAFHGASLLIVDDNDASNRLMCGRLKRLGYRVTAATSGAQALEMTRERNYDAVLLDIMMPEVDGDQVLRALRVRSPMTDLPIIMVTARDQSSDLVKALREGANDYVTKPIDFPVLVARIETHLTLKRLSHLKDEFTAIASHDLKSPITAMLAAAAILESNRQLQDALPPEARDMLGVFKSSTLRMRRIIEDFLDFEAAENGRLKLSPQPVGLDEVAREAAGQQLEVARAKQIELHLDLDAAVPRILGDRARIEQIVQNLLNNAIKFSPANSQVDVVVRGEGESHVLCEIRDHGPGLAGDDFDKLFCKRVRLSAQPTGDENSTGLGLYISRQLVRLHSGEIGADNNEGGGARFWFKLPAQVTLPSKAAGR